jgi:hypothetical protein
MAIYRQFTGICAGFDDTVPDAWLANTFGLNSRCASGHRMNSYSHRTRGILCVLGTVVLITGVGCLSIPVHITPRIQGEGGPSTLADSNTIRPGQTTRAEVLRDWAWCDAHSDTDRLFLGTVKRSTSKRVETLGPVYAGSDLYWEDVSLFVEFDNQGLVTRYYFVNRYDRLSAMVSWVRHAKRASLELSKSIQISAKIGIGKFLHKDWAENGIIVLAADGLEMRSQDKGAPGPVHFRLEQLGELRSGRWYGQHLTFHGVAGWENVNLALDLPSTLTLVRYLKQTRESALPR